MEKTLLVNDSILTVIYQIVKKESYPLKYQVHPRELILHSMQDWDTILASVNELENQGLVSTRQMETLHISLTEKGLQSCFQQQEG